jgi:hypothetical protein
MNTANNFNETLQDLAEFCSSVQWGKLDLDQYQLRLRLQTATSSSFNPEVGNAWRNRMIVRARLRRYTSD